MDQLFASIHATGQSFLGYYWPLVWNLVKIIAVVAPLMGAVAYLTLWERKVIGWMHVRHGPTVLVLLVCCNQSPTASNSC